MAAAETLLQWELAARLGRELTRYSTAQPARVAAATAGLARLVQQLAPSRHGDVNGLSLPLDLDRS